MTSRGDLRVEDPERYRGRTRRAVRGKGRRRFWLRRIGVLVLILLLWLTWSIGSALTAPGTDTTSVGELLHVVIPAAQQARANVRRILNMTDPFFIQPSFAAI